MELTQWPVRHQQLVPLRYYCNHNKYCKKHTNGVNITNGTSGINSTGDNSTNNGANSTVRGENVTSSSAPNSTSIKYL